MIRFFSIQHLLKGAAFLLGCFFFSACENDPKTIAEWTNNKVMVEEAKDIQTYLSSGSRIRAKLWAPYMLRYQTDTVYVEFPRSLHVDFFDSTGNVQSHLDSRYGKYFENLNRVYLRDSVVIFNKEGDTLRSPDLWWDQTSQKFYTDKKVKIRKSGNLIYGVGLDARQDLSDIVIKKVTGTVYVADSLAH
ncbi:MAG: LPS export ABC transporter periplasmic protein LptC [Flavisolibacter sp.]|jgi:LPS export ABC transporter protein LptC